MRLKRLNELELDDLPKVEDPHYAISYVRDIYFRDSGEMLILGMTAIPPGSSPSLRTRNGKALNYLIEQLRDKRIFLVHSSMSKPFSPVVKWISDGPEKGRWVPKEGLECLVGSTVQKKETGASGVAQSREGTSISEASQFAAEQKPPSQSWETATEEKDETISAPPTDIDCFQITVKTEKSNPVQNIDARLILKSGSEHWASTDPLGVALFNDIPSTAEGAVTFPNAADLCAKSLAADVHAALEAKDEDYLFHFLSTDVVDYVSVSMAFQENFSKNLGPTIHDSTSAGNDEAFFTYLLLKNELIEDVGMTIMEDTDER